MMLQRRLDGTRAYEEQWLVLDECVRGPLFQTRQMSFSGGRRSQE